MQHSKIIVNSIISLLFATTGYAANNQDGSGEINGHKLVWQELFDASELNPMRWDIEVNGSGGGNNELQYYTDSEKNVRLGDDGEGNNCLILTAIREKYLGKSFTSGRINSKNRIAFLHGKIEASIKLPKTANGLWPAFWMMGNDFDAVGWPRCGEIDIMEFGNANGIANGTQERYFNGACHWGPSSVNHPNYANAITSTYSLQDGEFHLYTLIWDENRVAMYVDMDKYPDNAPYYQMTIPYEKNEWSPGYYFHKENFILFNLAVGGSFTGINHPVNITGLNDGNNNTASMYVNYVRVYQKGTPDESTNFLDPGDVSGVDAPVEDDDIIINSNGVHSNEIVTVGVYSITGQLVYSANKDNVSFEALNPGVW